jgi:hypothetical protein
LGSEAEIGLAFLKISQKKIRQPGNKSNISKIMNIEQLYDIITVALLKKEF